MPSDMSDLQADIRRLTDKIVELKQELSDLNFWIREGLSYLPLAAVLLAVIVSVFKST